MNKAFRAAIVAAASLFAMAQPAHAEWLQATSKHFIVYGDMSEADLRKRVDRLERFDAAMRIMFASEEDSDVSTLYILNSLSELQDLYGEGGGDVGGFYQTTAQDSIGFVPERLPNQREGWKPEVILFHEYVHHVQLSSATQFYPGWMVEGMAELFATAQLKDDGSITLGAPNQSREWAMTGNHRWTVERLLESDTNPPSRQESIELYSRGWLMLHYLLFSGNRQGELTKFNRLINSGKRPLEAGREAFGNLDKLNSELERYLRASSIRTITISPEELKQDKSVTVRRLTDGERAILPTRMRSARGVDEKSAPKLLPEARAAAARFPDEVFVQRALAEMEYDAKNYAEAGAAADRVLAFDPQNVMAMVYKGRIEAALAVKDNEPERWKAARSWFLKANKTDPEHALPFVLWYDSFVAAKEPIPEAAVNGLMRAIVLVPQDSSLRLRVGVELIRAGDLPLARTILFPVGFNPHSSTDNPVRKLVLAMDEGSTKEHLLEKAAELKLDRVNEFDPPEPEDKDKKDGAKALR